MGKQPSKIDLIPAEVRETLNVWLRDPAISQLEATRRTNLLLEEIGHPLRVDKSGVNRYALKMEEAGAKLRQSREIAEMWIGKLGTAPQGQVGNLVNEILRTLSFDVTLLLQRGEVDMETAPAVVDMLKGLALTMQRLEQAANLNVKREAEIRKQALEDAADAVEKAAVQQGLNAEQAAYWRQQVLGV